MDVFQLFGKLVLNGKEQFDNDIEDTKQKGANLAEGIGKALQTAAKVGAVAIGACATAVGALAKKSLDGFAEYEQLSGGIATLFEDLSYDVEQNAKQAFKTAGMSANDYMETVMSFSASLNNSLLKSEGNIARAADLSNQIIVDMSDNANKMGTSMEMIQNAYGGFAKQNYTMLDNLKLGYGGTQQEMQRLLKDAQKISGIKYDISSFADIAEAIHVVQTEMGITGTTAAEAATTIEGSLSMTKSAWANLVTGIADENADLDALIDNLVESATTAARNIVPRLAQILSGISEAMAQIMPVIATELPVLLEQLLPGVISGAVALVNGLIMALPTILQILIEQLPSIIIQIAEALVACFPVLLQTVTDLFGQIWDYISLELLNTGTSFEDMSAKANEVFKKLWEEVKKVWDSLGKPIWDLIKSAIEIVKNVFSERMPEIKEFVSGAFSDIQSFWENNLKPCFEAIGDFIENTLAPIFEAVFTVAIGGVVDTVFSTIKDLWENTLKPVFTGITDFLTGVFTGDWEQALNGILGIATGIWNGIQTAIETPMELTKEIVNNAIDFIKEKFDFEWELPKLKLPHFNITGKFSLNPPSIPTFSVSWYKKAYDEAMVLSDPTIFGYSGESGKFLGGGEGNGNEVVAGEAHLMNMIQSAVAEQNADLVYYLEKLSDMVAEYFPQVIEAAGHDIVTNDGAIIARYTPMFNTALGKISRGKDRGR